MTDGNNHRNNSTVMRSCFEASFSSLFDNGDIEPRISSLVLPVFQVANQWGPKQVAKLVRDVDSARRSGDLNFFGGCLVLVERERRSHSCCSLVDRNPNYYIIDGKQRIKTITMIVSVCRYYDPENESIYTDWLARDIPFGIRYRLWLDKDINQIDNGRIFEDFILTPGGIGSLFDEDQDIAYSQYVAELRKNAICIMKLLQELGKENSLEFARYMVQRCKFIAIIVPNIELALKVSCSFNLSSGIPSPALEYYRARLYERLIRNMNGWHAQLALRDWNQIEVNLGGAESMQQFLIHFCCVQLYSGRYEDRSRIDYIIDVFNKEESTRETAVQKVLYSYFYSIRGEKIIAEVMKFSKIYKEKVMTQMSGNDRYNYSLDLLHYMTKRLPQRSSAHYNLWITIALKAASIYKIENSETFWKKLERLFAYFIITKPSAEIVARSCDRILQQIDQLRNQQLPGMYQWNQLDLDTRQVSRFRKLIQGNIYLENPPAARYLMLHLEHRRSRERLPNTLAIDEIATSVEHICPLIPQLGSNWLQDPWSEELRLGWLHKLGNIVLLERSHHTEVLNFGWCVKSEVYRKNRRGQPTSFLYTRELCDNSDWTPSLCNVRQQQLVEQLFKVYDLSDGGHSTDGDGENDDSGGHDSHRNEDDDGSEDDNKPENQNTVLVQRAIEILMQIKTEMNLGNRDVLTISKQLQNENVSAMFIGFDDSTRKYWLRHESGLPTDGEGNAQPGSTLGVFDDRHIKLLWSLGEIFDISHEIAEVLQQDSKSFVGSNGATTSGAKVGPVDRRRNHNTSEDTQFGPSTKRFKQLVIKGMSSTNQKPDRIPAADQSDDLGETSSTIKATTESNTQVPHTTRTNYTKAELQQKTPCELKRLLKTRNINCEGLEKVDLVNVILEYQRTVKGKHRT